MHFILKNKERFGFVFILLAGMIARWTALTYDLPYIYHSDEPKYIRIAQMIFKTGDMNPHFFNYPSLFLYLNTAIYLPYYGIGKLFGIFQKPDDIQAPFTLTTGVTWAPMPTTVLLGRLLTLAFGAATLYIVYRVGKQLTGKASAGLLAALFMAVSPSNVIHSRYITPDTFMVFFAALAFWMAILVFQEGKTWQYLLAGVCAGLTVSCKYNGGLILLPLLLAHLFRYGKTAWKQKNIYLALLLAAFSFLVTTPYAILDTASFLQGLQFEANHYRTGHEGMEGNTLLWYIDNMWNTAGIIYILALVQIVRGALARSKPLLLASIFPVVYFTFISTFTVRNDRTFLPLTPFLFLLAGSLLVDLYQKRAIFAPKLSRAAAPALAAGVVLLALWTPVTQTVSNAVYLLTPDSRELARAWIDGNLPPGSTIAIEAYAPFLDLDKFHVRPFFTMIASSPDWYASNQYDYLVFSKDMYGRYFADPGRYPVQVAQYEAFFQKFALVKAFHDRNGEVLVYKVR